MDFALFCVKLIWSPLTMGGGAFVKPHVSSFAEAFVLYFILT